MIHQLKKSSTGEVACYNTTLEISEKDNVLTFKFVAENSKYYCPYNYYNAPHYEGDVCEVFIGTDPNKEVYYEVEITPSNEIFLSKITYKGTDENNNPVLGWDFVEESFVEHSTTITETGYIAQFSFDKNKVLTGDGEMFFNAYRLETDGGEMEKHMFSLSPTMRNKFHVPTSYVSLKDYI